MKKNDQMIQLKQQLIRYKSKVNQFKQQIDSLEKELKFARATGTSQKIQVKQEDLLEKKLDAFAFFQFTTFLPEVDDENKDLLVLGNLNIVNCGTETLTHPLICIRVKPAKAITLGGKIKYDKEVNEDEIFTTTEEWGHIYKNWQEKASIEGEYWLRPFHCEKLLPDEKLSFTNFDLKIDLSNGEVPYKIEAFIYFKQLTQGIRAINRIEFQ